MSREAAVSALSALVSTAYAWAVTPSRRLRLWGDVPVSQRPCAFLFQGAAEHYTNPQSVVPKRTIEVKVFIYTDAKASTSIGASQQDAIMDALDAALAPPPGQTQNTLGGAVSWCRIDGEVFRDPGDLDGDGLLVVPIKITL